jgi:hypothetical protein
MVDRMYDNEGNLQTTQTGILRAFATFMKAKYAIKITCDSAIQDILQTIKSAYPQRYMRTLNNLFAMEEIRAAVKQGKQKKAPGIDGML